MALDPDFVALFCCPQCRGKLSSEKAPEGFACVGCKLFYSVEDDVPNFNVEDARPWAPSETPAL
ncbi:MAG: Trm112 family protein [Sandaracinaceae bacterium]|nr:Trm112 family protein [Sandaracinaceae bacterium]